LLHESLLLLQAAAAAAEAPADDLPSTAVFTGLAVAAEAGLLQPAELLPA
jgi:hypothetical protein